MSKKRTQLLLQLFLLLFLVVIIAEQIKAEQTVLLLQLVVAIIFPFSLSNYQFTGNLVVGKQVISGVSALVSSDFSQFKILGEFQGCRYKLNRLLALCLRDMKHNSKIDMSGARFVSKGKVRGYCRTRNNTGLRNSLKKLIYGLNQALTSPIFASYLRI